MASKCPLSGEAWRGGQGGDGTVVPDVVDERVVEHDALTLRPPCKVGKKTRHKERKKEEKGKRKEKLERKRKEDQTERKEEKKRKKDKGPNGTRAV